MKYKYAFTLAEVLITLGIIGIVAAITIPTLASNIQSAILKNQFKQVYNLLNQAVLGIQTKDGMPVNCYYVEKNLCTATCNPEDRNEYGDCTRYFCAETGGPLPPNFNGANAGCIAFQKQLFKETLKVSKTCKGNALANGCISDTHRGTDIVKKELNPDNEYSPNGMWSDTCLKNNCTVLVLSNGVLIMAYAKGSIYGLRPTWLIDINGKKGPNKYGYDIFNFIVKGTPEKGIIGFFGGQQLVERGGKTFDNMVKEVFGKK